MQAMSDRVAALARLVAAVERGGESCVRIPAMPAAADGFDGDRAAADSAGTRGLVSERRRSEEADPAAGLSRQYQRWREGQHEDAGSDRGRKPAAADPDGTFALSRRHRLPSDGWDEVAGPRAGGRGENMQFHRDGRQGATAAASGRAFGLPSDRWTWSGEREEDADCGADRNAAADPAGVPGLDQRLRMAGGSGRRRGLGTPPRAAPHLVALAARARSRPPLPRIAIGVAAIDAALGGGLERAGLHEIHAAAPGDEAAAAGFVAALCRRSLSDAVAALAAPERRNIVRLLDTHSAPAAPDGGPGQGESSAASISGDLSRRYDGSGRLLAALEGSSDRRGHAPLVSEDPDSNASSRGGHAPGPSAATPATPNDAALNGCAYVPDPLSASPGAFDDEALSRCGQASAASRDSTTISRGHASDAPSTVLATLNGIILRRSGHAPAPSVTSGTLEGEVLSRHGHAFVTCGNSITSNRGGPASGSSSAAPATLNGVAPKRSSHAPGQSSAISDALEGNLGRCGHVLIASESPVNTTSSQPPATPAALEDLGRCSHMPVASEHSDGTVSHRCGHESDASSAALTTLNGAAPSRSGHAPGQLLATPAALEGRVGRCEHASIASQGPDSIPSSRGGHVPGSPPVALATLNGAGLSQSGHASRPPSATLAIPDGTAPGRSGHASSPPPLARTAPEGAAPDRCGPPFATPPSTPAIPGTAPPSAWTAPPGRAVVWIETRFSAAEDGLLSPAGWRQLGLDPADLVHVEVGRVVDALAAAEEALACPALAAVVVEIRGPAAALDLVALRRLTLAARAAGRPCLLLRTGAKPVPTPALTRWSIAARPAAQPAGPATGADRRLMGLPAFAARLTRQRAGPEGDWILEWCADAGCFREPLPQPALSLPGDRPALSLGPSG